MSSLSAPRKKNTPGGGVFFGVGGRVGLGTKVRDYDIRFRL